MNKNLPNSKAFKDLIECIDLSKATGNPVVVNQCVQSNNKKEKKERRKIEEAQKTEEFDASKINRGFINVKFEDEVDLTDFINEEFLNQCQNYNAFLNEHLDIGSNEKGDFGFITYKGNEIVAFSTIENGITSTLGDKNFIQMEFFKDTSIVLVFNPIDKTIAKLMELNYISILDVKAMDGISTHPQKLELIRGTKYKTIISFTKKDSKEMQAMNKFKYFFTMVEDYFNVDTNSFADYCNELPELHKLEKILDYKKLDQNLKF